MMNPRNIGPRTRAAAAAVGFLVVASVVAATGFSSAAPDAIAAGQSQEVTCASPSTMAIAPVSASEATVSCSAPATTTTTSPPSTTTTTQPPATTTTTQPTAPSTDLIGLYNNGTSASTLGISHLQVTSDYAYGNGSCGYAVSGAQAAKGTQLLLGVGACTAAQDVVIGQDLLAGGQPNAIIRPMWEMNQHGWFTGWNESTMSASTFKAEWITEVNAFRSVASTDFKFDYDLTAGGTTTAGSGNNAAGRANFDSFAGTAYTDYIGIDVYDNDGTVAASQACIVSDAQFAQSVGLPMTIPEWGMYATDDPAFVHQIWLDSKLPTFAEESLFSASFYAKGSAGAAITDFPNSLAEYKTDFDSE